MSPSLNRWNNQQANHGNNLNLEQAAPSLCYKKISDHFKQGLSVCSSKKHHCLYCVKKLEKLWGITYHLLVICILDKYPTSQHKIIWQRGRENLANKCMIYMHIAIIISNTSSRGSSSCHSPYYINNIQVQITCILVTSSVSRHKIYKHTKGTMYFRQLLIKLDFFHCMLHVMCQ